jgi:hypothetical protein
MSAVQTTPKALLKGIEVETYYNTYQPLFFLLQDLTYRTNYACKSVPAGKNLQATRPPPAPTEVRRQAHPHRDFLTGLISPVKKDL